MLTRKAYRKPITEVIRIRVTQSLLTMSDVTLYEETETDESDIQYSRRIYGVWDDD